MLAHLKTCYTLYRLETSDDLQVALGRIPQYKIKPEKVFHCSRVLDIIILSFHLFTKKHHLFFQPQDVADLVSSEVRNVFNGMVYESRHKNKRFAEGIFITPFPLLQDNTSSALSSYVSVFFYIYHLWEAFTAVLLRCIVVKTLITLCCPLCL